MSVRTCYITKLNERIYSIYTYILYTIIWEGTHDKGQKLYIIICDYIISHIIIYIFTYKLDRHKYLKSYINSRYSPIKLKADNFPGDVKM